MREASPDSGKDWWDLSLELDPVVRTCIVLMAHLNKRGKSATRGATWDWLVPGVYTLLASELWQDHCPSWGSFSGG